MQASRVEMKTRGESFFHIMYLLTQRNAEKPSHGPSCRGIFLACFDERERYGVELALKRQRIEE